MAVEQMEERAVASLIDDCSWAFMIVDSELPLIERSLQGKLHHVVSGIYFVDHSELPGSGGPALGPGCRPHIFPHLDQFVAGCDPDMLVISERPDLIRRDVAFAVIELALKGIPVCTVAEFLAAPELRREAVPSPGVVDHLVAALAASARGQRVKRAFDLFVGGFGLLLALPLFVLIAAAIRLESTGPVFFVQERLGRLRVPFPCLKFRTMREDAEQDTGPVWACSDDPRITRVGRFLRRSRLDELPQLINVVRGEMSIVGARPIRRHFADQLAAQVPFYDVRFVEKPGLTGWAQVKHSYSSTFTEQIEKFYHDYHYVRNCSIWLDLYIMALTVGVMVRMKGT